MRVDSAGVGAMAARWGALVDGLDGTAAPTGLLSYQPSAAAVNGAHVDVAVFTAGLAGRVRARAIGVGQADARYIANEAESATDLAAVAPPVTSV
ncbi:hypothetical protein A5756_20645 [Mycobacterium sp. 852002-53434_SCH5985345]|nr:hypothetical protein A5756_20645 [Mycobacterium sp. 852002-53434_SCH5985345]OBF72856.1 hypothetical protein A5750_01445 [Mycobacterium sp. 852002-51613_SCH5001154]OBF90963.1 hypothetical protein A5773_24740 [Mycobacterium sp. 852014-52450_SCH5900713]